MATMFYWSPIMAEGRMEPEDIHNLVAAYQFLSSQDFIDPSRVGIGGFCVGASYSIMAATQEPSVSRWLSSTPSAPTSICPTS